jgi:IS30 family transposase
MAEIGRQLGRSTSTITRELSRNKRETTGYYAAQVAHDYAIARRHKSRRGTQFSEEQWHIILYLLKCDFSPEQISNTLKRVGYFSISHETI